MIPPKGKKRYHSKPSFFSFFGNLPPNNSGELTKKENLYNFIGGIKNTLEVVSLFTLVKRLSNGRGIRCGVTDVLVLTRIDMFLKAVA